MGLLKDNLQWLRLERLHITVASGLHQLHLNGRMSKINPLLKKNVSAQHVRYSEASWKKVLWSDETKIEMFGH